MKQATWALAALAAVIFSSSGYAATITLEALDIRSSNVFMGIIDPNVSGYSINGNAPSGSATVADPLDLSMTYNNLDLDGDGTANDSVTFTLRATKVEPMPGGNLRIFNQGIDTGFGNLNDVQVSMLSVSGTTTDGGFPILFDGFTGAGAGSFAFGGTPPSRTVEINGIFVDPGDGAGTGDVGQVDFPLTSTVTFDNSGGSIGTIVARSYDLQFSAIPEPTALALLGLGALGLIPMRRHG